MRPFRIKLSKIWLIVAAFALVMYAEWIYPSQAFTECTWPLSESATHIALIADPQLVDANTYPKRAYILQWISMVISDLYMARNFRLLNRRLHPDAIFFLGDLFDGGRHWGDTVWYRELQRWNRVFPKSETLAQYYNVVGNHDIGSRNDINVTAYDRFCKEFGNPNSIRTVGGHEFVTVDSLSLMATDLDVVKDPVLKFLEEQRSRGNDRKPTIILSHVPFYRPDGSYCGFEREGKPIRYMQGHQYITELHPSESNDLINIFHPVFIFSGDDHDACTFIHYEGTEYEVVEHSVKSFNMCMGIMRPGFQLLSVDSQNRHETDSCLLGKPFYPIWIQLVGFAIITVSILLHSWSSRRNSKYERINDPEFNKNSRFTVHSNREVISKLLTVGVTWVIGQFVIYWWSYTTHL